MAARGGRLWKAGEKEVESDGSDTEKAVEQPARAVAPKPAAAFDSDSDSDGEKRVVRSAKERELDAFNVRGPAPPRPPRGRRARGEAERTH